MVNDFTEDQSGKTYINLKYSNDLIKLDFLIDNDKNDVYQS